MDRSRFTLGPLSPRDEVLFWKSVSSISSFVRHARIGQTGFFLQTALQHLRPTVCQIGAIGQIRPFLPIGRGAVYHVIASGDRPLGQRRSTSFIRSPDATLPSSITRRYQPVRPVSLIRRTRSGTPHNLAGFQHVIRGWETCTTALPIRYTSPIQTLCSSKPVTVKSPKAP